MPIANVDLTNSLEYFRMITNQGIISWNYLTGNSYSTPGTITINPPVTSSFISLNVANGLIYGNAAQIFSIPLARISYGLFKNFSFQNTTISILAGTNLTGGGLISLGNVSVVMNAVTIDSLVNTRQDLVLSANAISGYISNINYSAARFTTGVLSTSNGGTGLTTFANGQTLIGTAAGILASNTIGANQGIAVAAAKGSITLSANLIQGQNVTFSSTNPLTISRNTMTSATTTTLGPTQLNDTITAAGTTNQAATANSLNAVAKMVGTATSVTVANGRLIQANSWTTAGKWTWTVPDNFAYAIVTLVGAGAGGGAANTGNVANTLDIGAPGPGGAYLKGIITLSDIMAAADDAGSPNTVNITVGAGGVKGAATANTNPNGYRAGRSGGDTIFGGADPQKWMMRANGGQSPFDVGGSLVNPQVPSAGLWLSHWSASVTAGPNIAAPGVRIGNSFVESYGTMGTISYVIWWTSGNKMTISVAKPGQSIPGINPRLIAYNNSYEFGPVLVGRENNPPFPVNGTGAWYWSANNDSGSVPGTGGIGGIGWGVSNSTSIGGSGSSLTYARPGDTGSAGAVYIEAYST